MQFEITGIEEIDDQEAYDYYSAIIDQFKNEYQYLFDYACSKASNFIIKFSFDPGTEKFKLVHIPNNYRSIHTRLLEVEERIKKWF